MKIAVKIITVAAALSIVAGGAALDSENLLIPTLMIAPALAWFSLVAWANR